MMHLLGIGISIIESNIEGMPLYMADKLLCVIINNAMLLQMIEVESLQQPLIGMTRGKRNVMTETEIFRKENHGWNRVEGMNSETSGVGTDEINIKSTKINTTGIRK